MMAIVLVSLAVMSCGANHMGSPGKKDQQGGSGDRYEKVGLASYYARKLHGRRTASGERYDEKKLTAAHPHLPFGTQVTVVNLKNGRSVTVRINDRGPFKKCRIIDVSYSAARQLGMLREGVVRVKMTAMP
jgi:rare lipoprotein A